MGKTRGNNEIKKRKKSRFQLGSDSDSDSEYVDKVVEEANASMDTNEKWQRVLLIQL